jgi:hypothetical protein
MTRPTINRKLYITSIDVKRKMYMLFQEMKFEGAILNDPEIKELFEGDMQIKNIHKHTTFFREGHTGKILIAIGIIYRALKRFDRRVEAEDWLNAIKENFIRYKVHYKFDKKGVAHFIEVLDEPKNT